MGTAVVILILVVIAVVAVRSSRKHLKGEGGCCGGGEDQVAEESKTLSGPIVAKKIIHIEGMHCDACKNRVERQLNRLDGVAGQVDLKKKIAVVSMEQEVDDEDLRIAVERLDYKVTGIERG